MPAAMQANGLAPDEPASRTVEVEAFCSWSACRMKMRSIARASTGLTLYSSARHREAHAQEVGRVVEVVLRIDERLADRVFVGHRRERRHLGDHADRGDHALDADRRCRWSRDRRPTARRPQPTITAIGCASRRKPWKKRLICSCTIVWRVTRSRSRPSAPRSAVRRRAADSRSRGSRRARRAARSDSRDRAGCLRRRRYR